MLVKFNYTQKQYIKNYDKTRLCLPKLIFNRHVLGFVCKKTKEITIEFVFHNLEKQIVEFVETSGFEPLTSAVQKQRSTN